MITHLRRPLVAGEIPSGEGSVFHFLDIYALGFGLEACAALFLGKSWRWVALGIVGSIFFHLLGTNWPRIKPIIGPRLASALERTTKNRLYRSVIYSVIVIALLASVGFRVYHYSPQVVATSQNDPPATAQNNEVPQSLPAQTTTTPHQNKGKKKKPLPASAKAAPDVAADKNKEGTDSGVQKPTPPASQQPSTMSLDCAPGANCAVSNSQQGGITAGSITFQTPLPRTVVTPDALAEKLLSLPHRELKEISVVQGSGTDAFPLALQIRGILAKAGWKVPDAVDTDIVPAGNWPDIEMLFHGDYLPNARTPADFGLSNDDPFTIFANGLTNSRLMVWLHRDPSLAVDAIQIRIGLSPR